MVNIFDYLKSSFLLESKEEKEKLRGNISIHDIIIEDLFKNAIAIYRQFLRYNHKTLINNLLVQSLWPYSSNSAL